jgi:hypothetical protein
MPVLRKIKILGTQRFDNLGNTARVDKHRAEHGLLRLNAVRQLPGQQFIH